MKIRIVIDRVTALNAGQDRHGLCVVDVPAAEFADWEREILARYTYSGSAPEEHAAKADFFLDQASPRYMQGGDPHDLVRKVATEPTAEAVHAVLAAIRQADVQVAAEKAAKEERGRAAWEARILEIAAAPIEDLIDQWGNRWEVDADLKSDLAKDPRIAPRAAEARDLVEARNAEIKRAEVAEREERERQERAIPDYIAAWIAEHGTPGQRRRQDAGLLPEWEAKDAIREATFRPLDGFARYVKLVAGDVCECEQDTCNVSFRVEDSAGLTDEEFEDYVKLREAMPGATIVVRDHIGVADGCGASAVRKSGLVSLEVGPLTFSREYAIGGEAAPE